MRKRIVLFPVLCWLITQVTPPPFILMNELVNPFIEEHQRKPPSIERERERKR